jgi:hypothetical protein
VKVFREVTGGSTVQNQHDCLTSDTLCPKGYASNDDPARGLVEGFCKGFDPPRCLWSSRGHPARWSMT